MKNDSNYVLYACPVTRFSFQICKFFNFFITRKNKYLNFEVDKNYKTVELNKRKLCPIKLATGI